MHAYCAQNLLHKLGIFVSDKHHLYFCLFNMFIRNCIRYLHIKVGKTSTVYYDGNLIKMVAQNLITTCKISMPVDKELVHT